MALWMLVACASRESPEEVTIEAPDAQDIAHDSFREWGDTADPASTPTLSVTDDPIGPTALDGVWLGDLDFTEVFTPGADPHVLGTVTLLISGDAERHVIFRAEARGWDPQVPIGRPYGPLTGIGFATLDPADLTSFRLDLTFGAPQKAIYSKNAVRVRLIDDALTMSLDDVVGVGAFQFGHRITWTATRAP